MSIFRRTKSKNSIKEQDKPLTASSANEPLPTGASNIINGHLRSNGPFRDLGLGQPGDGAYHSSSVPLSKRKEKPESLRNRIISQPRMINVASMGPSPSPTTSNQPTPRANDFSHRAPLSPTNHSPLISPPSPFLSQQSSSFLSTRFPLLSRGGASAGGLTSQASSMTLSSSASQNLSSGPWVDVTSGTSADTTVGEVKRGLGYLWPEAGLVLGLEDLVGLVEDCCREIRERGLKTPLLFSYEALPFSPHRLTALLRSFTATLRPFPSQMPVSQQAKKTTEKYKAYMEDMRFAGECEIAWLLRWGLGRVVRVDRTGRDGLTREARGLLDWERYEDWRGRERVSQYDPRMFDALYRGLPGTLVTILKEIFNLLMHLAANSTDSGLTPSVLSGLFGPLLFGLGSHSCPFEVAHAAFVRSSGALEHLLLAYIRYEQARHDRLKGGFPGRLKDWIKGYPGMIISDRELDQGLPRRGVKVKRLEKVRRNVRAYSKDLTSSAQEWEREMRQHGGIRWDAWESVLPPASSTRRSRPHVSEQPQQPFLSEKHRKRLFLATDTIPLPFSSSPSNGFEKVETPSSGSGGRVSSQIATTSSHDSLAGRYGGYGSVADQTWREFEGFGFGDGLDKSKLDFNLYEGAKKEILQAKRQTISWQDFASPQGGFDRSNDALTKSLLFSPPVEEQIQYWPVEREEMQKKLKKAYKEAIPFTWDTTPVIVNARGAYVEEMFLDAWADLLFGGGWTDTEELTFREANWVLVEYRLQGAFATMPPPSEDKVFLFEEIVPPAYQDQLANPKQKKTGGLFSRSKPTRQVTPHKEGQATPTRDEAEFDAILRRHTPTKLVTLSKPLNGSTARAELGTFASTPVLTEGSPSKLKPTKSDSSKERTPSVPQTHNGSMRALFRRRNSQEPWTSGQPAPHIPTDYDQIETRTMSAPSSGESGWGDDDQNPSTPGPRKQEGERWIGVTVAAPPGGLSELAGFPVDIRNTGHLLPTTPHPGQGLVLYPNGSGMGHSPNLSEESETTSSHPTLLTPRTTQSRSSSSHSSRVSTGDSDSRASAGVAHDQHSLPKGFNPVQYGDQSFRPDLMAARANDVADDAEERLMESTLPPVLGPPLPINNPRDTVFSVIEGYGHHRTNSDGATAPPLPIVRQNGSLDPENSVSSDVFDEPKGAIYRGRGPDYTAVHARESYASELTEGSESSEPEHPDDDNEVGNAFRHSSVSSEFDYQPPPPIIGADDIAAIARQPSPGRVEHGIPLQSLQEEEDEDEQDGPAPLVPARPLRRRAAQLA